MNDDIVQPPSPEDDRLLDRSTAALREAAIPDGPSIELLARTRKAIALAEASSHGGWSMYVHRPALRAAAVVAVLLGTVAVYWLSVRHGANGQPKDIVKKQDQQRSVPSTTAPVAPTPVIVDRSPKTPESNRPPLPHIENLPQNDPLPALADGTVVGRVIFAGPLPVPQELREARKCPQCVEVHRGPIYDESMVVGADGALANVVVSVSEGLSSWLHEEFPPPATPATLDQRGCVFSPHVVAVMVGQPLIVKNSDPLAHNVNLLAVNNPNPNLGQPATAESETDKFLSPEVFRVRCDMHPWMEGWVRVLDNPFFAVTGADGRFTIRGLPPGTYTLKAWHERLGVVEAQVTIKPGHGAATDFMFWPK